MRNRNPYLIYLIYSSVMMLLRYMHFTTAAVYYVTVVGLNPFELVLVGTTLMVVILVSEVPTGVLADTYSRRLSIIIGTALIGTGFLIEGLVPSFAAVLASQLIWGIGHTFTSGALEAWIADEPHGRSLERVLLRGSQLGNAGALIGIGLSVVLANLALNLPLVAAGLTSIGLALLLALVMPENGFSAQRQYGEPAWRAAGRTLRAGLRLARGSRVLLVIMAVTFCFGMASESFDRLWEVHFLTNAAFPTQVSLPPVTWFGLINAIALLLTLGTTELVQRRLDKHGQLGLPVVLAVITALVLVGMIAFGMAGTFGLALPAYLATVLLRRLYNPFYSAWLNQHAQSQTRATVNSLAGQVDAIGQIAGGPLFGWVATAYTTGTAIVAAAFALLPALLLYRLATSPAAAPQPEVDAVATQG